MFSMIVIRIDDFYCTNIYHDSVFFFVLLTVHLSIILVTDQLNEQILVL